ncbi:MAG: T9SS type A sorting domain-containing protein [Bacteroidota bacterium]
MRKLYILKTIAMFIFFVAMQKHSAAQCYYVAGSGPASDSLNYTFSGGTFSSFGCTPVNPSYWMTGNGEFVTVNFTNPEDYPTFRVWGMNDDDSASVTVNGSSYPLNNLSASYDAKVVCGLSPGPNGVIFWNGKLVGANTNPAGNYSYQNVQLRATNISTFTITGINGAGWGFVGVSINCPLQTSGVNEINNDDVFSVYPNPGNGEFKITCNTSIAEINVSDLSGRMVFKSIGDNNRFLKLNNSGAYFLTVISGEKVMTKKLIVN